MLENYKFVVLLYCSIPNPRVCREQKEGVPPTTPLASISFGDVTRSRQLVGISGVF